VLVARVLVKDVNEQDGLGRDVDKADVLVPRGRKRARLRVGALRVLRAVRLDDGQPDEGVGCAPLVLGLEARRAQDVHVQRALDWREVGAAHRAQPTVLSLEGAHALLERGDARLERHWCGLRGGRWCADGRRRGDGWRQCARRRRVRCRRGRLRGRLRGVSRAGREHGQVAHRGGGCHCGWLWCGGRLLRRRVWRLPGHRLRHRSSRWLGGRRGGVLRLRGWSGRVLRLRGRHGRILRLHGWCRRVLQLRGRRRRKLRLRSRHRRVLRLRGLDMRRRCGHRLRRLRRWRRLHRRRRLRGRLILAEQ
jgi:hypothetical protein